MATQSGQNGPPQAWAATDVPRIHRITLNKSENRPTAPSYGDRYAVIEGDCFWGKVEKI